MVGEHFAAHGKHVLPAAMLLLSIMPVMATEQAPNDSSRSIAMPIYSADTKADAIVYYFHRTSLLRLIRKKPPILSRRLSPRCIGTPRRHKSRTFEATYKFKSRAMVRKVREYRNPIVLADECKQLLRGGKCGTHADVAAVLGVSRVRVTQLLNLIRLSPVVCKQVRGLGRSMAAPGHLRTLPSASEQVLAMAAKGGDTEKNPESQE